MKYLVVIFSLLFSVYIFAQDNITHKEFKIIKVENSPKIDGILDDDAWKNANIASDFVMFRPRSNEPEPENIKTEIKIVYDDNAIYFGAYLHDDKVNEIPMEFQTRDNFGNADFLLIALNPSNDGINQTEFVVMSTGNQNDAKVLPNGNEDWSWNAVWDSAVKIVDDGWIVEVKIPYSALRFSNEKIQTWGLNFHRQHRKNRDQYSWNFISRENGSIAQYDGIITGIKNIEPPVRLSFNPFVTASNTSFDGNTEFNWSAGLDVKYGISENFTLDATLIPDFGQVAFDDVTLNLGPFEQRFSEQRAFFTEGTDLFSKGNFFESRRIGSSPVGIDIDDNEEIVNRPNKVDVLNIIKISGRTKKGLGIGVLNAITEKTKAKITKTEIIDDIEVITYRNEVVEPLANYNVLVIDQQFNKNSSISLVNTNVIREGHFRDANVTGLLYDIKTKDNKYGIDGGIAMSNVYNGNEQNPLTGFEGDFEIGKISGNHQYYFEFEFITRKYDKNDLGFQRLNNNMGIGTDYSYRTYEPKGIFNNYGINVWTYSDFLMENNKDSPSYFEKATLYKGTRVGFNTWFNTKKQLSYGANINAGIGKQYDYYGPRVDGRFYKLNPNVNFNAWFSTDYSKRLALDISAYHGFRVNETRSGLDFNISPRYRLNNKITLSYSFYFNKNANIKSYVNSDDEENIIFGNRDVKRITNSISTKYNFTTKSALSLTFRHFWSPVQYDEQFFKLENDGTLSESNYSENEDINFNTWNLDLNFNWEFAPGSQLVALYRNSIFNEDEHSKLNFTDNLDNLFKENILHNFSIKLIYYLDYNQAKTWL